MAEEKILKDEILSDEQLEQVAGGTYRDIDLSIWISCMRLELLGGTKVRDLTR